MRRTKNENLGVLKQEVGRRIRALLSLSTLTQKEIAELANVPYQSLQNWLRGRYLVGSDFLFWLATKGVNVNWLLLGEGEMFIDPEKFKKELVR